MSTDFDARQLGTPPRLDVEGLRADFLGKNGRYCQLVGLFGPELAKSTHVELVNSDSWGLAFCSGDRLLGIAPNEYRDVAGQERRFIAEACYRAATDGFAFLREELWQDQTTKATHKQCGRIDDMAQYFRGQEFLNLCAAAIGVEGVQIVELSFVRYGTGDFCAFTIGPPMRAEIGFTYDLTPAWELEWGGLLEFMSFTGGIEKAYAPRLDSLCIYSLHTHHEISCVAPFARARRYAICGKLDIVGRR
jgi:hypothetical protein